ncbi:MAG: CPBP family intramembrane metalloprotease [Chloroflexi bacterium]|nr:CPBP family intramembrane metalloprotease [Chloroflexota bacterium]
MFAQLAQSFAGIRQGIVLSLLVAFGEETFFRGALQPVFGNLLTSVFFLILHTQYTLTPASLLLFLVSLALGWLRNRHSTTAAFVAHFVYNGALLTLSSLQGGV